MSHTCTHALVHCMDFRLNPSIQEFLEAHDLTNTTDIIAIAGGVKDINEHENGFVQNQLDLSIKLHNTGTILLMNHTDCGAYGGGDKFDSVQEEKEFHINELRRAKEKVSHTYPNVEITLLLGETLNREQTHIRVVE